MSNRGAAEEWLAQDPDEQTRAELTALLDDEAALAERFGSKLEFGTAGLRGEMGAGPNRMNRVTVMRAAAGLAARLKRDNPAPSVVIGYDARHKSDVFAADTAAVLSGAGVTANLLPRSLPTPVLAYAVRYLGADAGVMVTASHNPPRDNGYKVYWGDGAQIVPPLDSEISAAIDAVGRVDELPRGPVRILGDGVVKDYVETVAGLTRGDARAVSVAYTPMHGVGRDVALRAFERAGFAAPFVVAEQSDPDPDFPTVAFPNPEEPGAMDLALALGAATNADIVIANDPDADRCAVAAGGRMLTGDEVGGLLAEYVLRHTAGEDRLVVTTIVSSSLLGKIAKAHGVRYAQSLTGFKWIVHTGTGRLVFGYEEALGYCVGGDTPVVPQAREDRHLPVRDKDGISAALTITALAAEAKQNGLTLLDLLDDQARRYGLHATAQRSVRVTDVSAIAATMARLRNDPPTALGGRQVEKVEDLVDGQDGLPPTDGLRLWLADNARVVIRPSGTEPKLKCYLEVVVPVTGSVTEARASAAADLDALGADLDL